MSIGFEAEDASVLKEQLMELESYSQKREKELLNFIQLQSKRMQEMEETQVFNKIEQETNISEKYE